MARPGGALTTASPPPAALRVLDGAAALADAGAQLLADEVRAAVRARGACALALSGGRTPRALWPRLARAELPWSAIHLFQVDERFAPAESSARNWTVLRAALVAPAGIPPERAHAMPVDDPDPRRAGARYARALERAAGAPAVLDVVHLGLGHDGHTASLFAGDPALEVEDADVAATGLHAGWRRLTLTLPALSRARCAVWLVSGAEKAEALARLLAGDTAIPAARVAAPRRVVLADREAAGRR